MGIHLDKCHTPAGPAIIPAIQLKRIWQVDEDRNYINTKSWSNQTGFIMVRTHNGEGMFALLDGKTIKIPSWSFVVIQANQIVKYQTAKDRWNFWWFEIEAAGQFHIPLNRVFETPVAADEIKKLDEISDMLVTGFELKRTNAIAIFLSLICQWCEELDTENISEDDAFVRKVTEIFRSSLSRSISIESISAKFGMSSRWFRKKFINATGLPPKKYYDNMRLETAMEMLRMNLGTATELSRMLGYSSLYHFSREFKKHFGKPPSKFNEI